MKRRLKFTPFAKIVFVAIIIAAARYVYLHQDEITEGKFFNFKDTVAVNKSEKRIENASDTVVFYIRKKDSCVIINVNQDIIVINDSSGLAKDTFYLTLSSGVKGKIISE